MFKTGYPHYALKLGMINYLGIRINETEIKMEQKINEIMNIPNVNNWKEKRKVVQNKKIKASKKYVFKI